MENLIIHSDWCKENIICQNSTFMENKKTLDFLLIRSAYFLLIVIGVLSTSNLNTVISSATLSEIDLILAIIIAVNAIINLFRMGRISSKLFYFLGLIFFSLVLSLIFKSYSIVLLYLCGISAFNFSSRELVKIYFCSTFIGVVVSAMFGILGIINFSNLGFTSKNAIGFFIFSECLLYLYLNSDFKKIIKVFILLILFFIEFFVVKDRTAGILSIIYLVIVLNKRMLKNKLTVTLPFVLAIVSMFLGEKFTLDSENVNFDLYDEFLSRQTRYNMLKKINPEKANILLEENKNNAIARFNYYKSLE